MLGAEASAVDNGTMDVGRKVAQIQAHVPMEFVRNHRLRGDGTGSVGLPQNWASPVPQGGNTSADTGDNSDGQAVGPSELEKENDALRRNLTLLEENASLRKRIDELAT